MVDDSFFATLLLHNDTVNDITEMLWIIQVFSNHLQKSDYTLDPINI